MNCKYEANFAESIPTSSALFMHFHAKLNGMLLASGHASGTLTPYILRQFQGAKLGCIDFLVPFSVVEIATQSPA